jgi:hypothetical protein
MAQGKYRARSVAEKMASPLQREPIGQVLQAWIGYPCHGRYHLWYKKHTNYIQKLPKRVRLSGMKVKKSSLSTSFRMNEEELATAEWLAKDTKRTRNNAINWAVAEKAKERGYIPKVTKKKS